ncbi:MAG TPA: S26 family signal peptidase, partial [Halococcus sp.]|nr:S26 family signal peptidase [Halococcus sp.]
MDSGDGGAESWPGQWDGETDSGDDAESGHGTDGDQTSEGRGPLARVRWFMDTDEEWVAFVREVASSLAIVAVIGLLLFAVSGIWPPMVAVESGSMSPNLQIGDLVFIMEEHRFAGAAAHGGTGVVPFHAGAAVGYKEFNKYGDVIVYRRYGREHTTPIIHRARFWVNGGENWYDEANQAYVGSADNCKELANCPAEHAGFITKGDNNVVYDQVDTGLGPISSPVKPKWIIGTAEFRIPWLGRI